MYPNICVRFLLTSNRTWLWSSLSAGTLQATVASGEHISTSSCTVIQLFVASVRSSQGSHLLKPCAQSRTSHSQRQGSVSSSCAPLSSKASKHKSHLPLRSHRRRLTSQDIPRLQPSPTTSQLPLKLGSRKSLRSWRAVGRSTMGLGPPLRGLGPPRLRQTTTELLPIRKLRCFAAFQLFTQSYSKLRQNHSRQRAKAKYSHWPSARAIRFCGGR